MKLEYRIGERVIHKKTGWACEVGSIEINKHDGSEYPIYVLLPGISGVTLRAHAIEIDRIKSK
jgi:hypothetical protein